MASLRIVNGGRWTLVVSRKSVILHKPGCVYRQSTISDAFRQPHFLMVSLWSTKGNEISQSFITQPDAPPRDPSFEQRERVQKRLAAAHACLHRFSPAEESGDQ